MASTSVSVAFLEAWYEDSTVEVGTLRFKPPSRTGSENRDQSIEEMD
jgi:hypothetical protein